MHQCKSDTEHAEMTPKCFKKHLYHVTKHFETSNAATFMAGTQSSGESLVLGAVVLAQQGALRESRGACSAYTPRASHTKHMDKANKHALLLQARRIVPFRPHVGHSHLSCTASAAD
jgi:hypothetical protein